MIWHDEFCHAADAWGGLMEPFWDGVVERGYEPNDCTIEVLPMQGQTTLQDYRRALKVRGRTVAEVDSRWTQTGDFEFTCSHIERLIAWPPFNDAVVTR